MAFLVPTLDENPTAGEIINWQTAINAVIGSRVVGRVRTTDATVTTLLRFAPQGDVTCLAKSIVWARRDNGDAASYVVYSGWTKKSGTFSLLGATHTPRHQVEDQAAWQVEVVIADGRPVVQVTGSVGHNITWLGTIELHEVKT